MNDDELKKMRAQVDLIDSEIINLCLKRLLTTKEILSRKKVGKIALIDFDREKQILEKFEAAFGPHTTKDRIQNFVSAFFALNPYYRKP